MTDGLDRWDEPRRRKPWPLLVALGVVLLLLTCGLPAVLLVGVLHEAAGRSVVGRLGPAAAADPATLAAGQLGERIAVQLDRQATALLGGDRAGFLAVAEPAARPALTRRYDALRALRVTVWRPEQTGLPTLVPGRPDEWRIMVRFQYCLVVPGCRPSPVLINTRWRDAAGAPLLVAMEESRSVETGTRPWEVSELVVAVGPRTVVATTPALRGKLPGLLRQAEAAARAADGYAVGGAPPDRYRVFYAGRAEWLSWYGGGRPTWTGGYAVTVGGGHYEVVLNADGLSATGADDLLRHELTHAASLPERGYPGTSTWWLVEGIAEYAGTGATPVGRYEGLAEVRKMLAPGGGWNGRLDDLAPADDAPAQRVGGSYGVSYLAVRHLVDRFGEQRVLAFFRAVVHDRRTPEKASVQAFGEFWTGLHDECVGYARSAAG
ncbi:hypothetical protein ABT023_19885 [Micromonospora sp. NPDC002296]|uniref:hypothetical protein n=1 Tax=Micromonospora sp. NPDC002296 TaxID=3154271 RepID=UPI00332D209B